ncbi:MULTISPECIES: hypothetical protein [Flavobacterium]|uniref:hypothetical protein n=1 Tax=Flavobacterium TaxID=237 RepID=UPI001FCC6347|nr:MULTISPECIES: hypothetical protein [Flavobacterium]UOK43020.1 hypothetical protein LZF87_02610 [Flavobacterium enshiense]
MKNKTVLLWLVGGVIGATAGYFYFLYFGCKDSCTITSSPINSTLYGTVMGGLLFSMFDTKKKK